MIWYEHLSLWRRGVVDVDVDGGAGGRIEVVRGGGAPPGGGSSAGVCMEYGGLIVTRDAGRDSGSCGVCMEYGGLIVTRDAGRDCGSCGRSSPGAASNAKTSRLFA